MDSSGKAPNNPGTIKAYIVKTLTEGNYNVHVSPIPLKNQLAYKTQDGSYTLNIIPDNLPNLITVAASDSPYVETLNLHCKRCK